ncbi:MAG: hypothetical protein WAN65_07015 [Candidatus Sulfotelmatobacter sp.]
MNLPARYQSVTALYPVARDNAIRGTLQSALTWYRNGEGKALLHRELSSVEREALQARYKILAEALKHPHSNQIVARISQMIMGFGAAIKVSKVDATTIAAQYANVLKGLPMWAIERAINKFERGEITIEQMEGVNRAYWPSTAQLHPIAQQICGEFFIEIRHIHDALHGVVEKIVSEEERTKVGDLMRDLVESMKSDLDAQDKAARATRHRHVAAPDNDELIKHYGRKKPDGESATA